ncbi:hypothetical protein PTQ19_07245 [Microbacterium esteraromaticum]|nr:hypothetical protein [Microbacterium esteraromaticum]WDH80219.1 hypothetical protein PTQ19_07245 [Microbacterium esteraromaticum]
MRDTPDASVCPHCGYRIEIEPVGMPPAFDGPDIDDWRPRPGV